jgi:hypothetical protein
MKNNKPTDWTDPKWSDPRVTVSASWGGAQSVEGK